MEVFVSVAASSDVLTTNKSPKTGRLEQNRFLSVKHVQSDDFVEYISASANRPSLRLKARRSFSSARLFLRPRAAERRPAYRRHPAGKNCKSAPNWCSSGTGAMMGSSSQLTRIQWDNDLRETRRG